MEQYLWEMKWWRVKRKLCITRDTFLHLLENISPYIEKTPTNLQPNPKLNNFLQSSYFCILHLFLVYFKRKRHLQSVLLKIELFCCYTLDDYSKSICVFDLWGLFCQLSKKLTEGSLYRIYFDYDVKYVSFLVIYFL